MTEREKMLSGANYNSRDSELLEQYYYARKLLKQYNEMEANLFIERQNILKGLFEHIGNNVWIEAPFFCDYGDNISIGKGTFINMNCILLDNNKISIGENVLIAPHVQIYTASHPLKASERIVENRKGASYLTSSKPVSIGSNVWIGGNSVICPGVTIGDNVTIGAGSVVTKSVPSDVLAYGNPCQIIKKI
ncbi:sugar O-acetyltransferase [Maribacter sp. PR1]|uniref:Acetyltransferase n=1 Tax=Maribacter cobaltidurans TaxID=1178778 RepID=A0ABU7IWQ1_9FLAO|nr:MULTISPECIES: sugar O-acetyltransferase [Maribacter]MDC6389973.1 sugar O-acetyltransferase [Maribacter sp. PR1]MEE1977363.1 sugar O-acetyltransferase [Maribacter cobaltidurans]